MESFEHRDERLRGNVFPWPVALKQKIGILRSAAIAADTRILSTHFPPPVHLNRDVELNAVIEVLFGPIPLESLDGRGTHRRWKPAQFLTGHHCPCRLWEMPFFYHWAFAPKRRGKSNQGVKRR